MVKVKGIPKNLGGTDFVIPPLALGPLEQLQDRIAAFDGTLNKESIAVVIDAAHAALKRNYPDITREDVAELVDVENMIEVFEAVMDVSGLRRKQIEADAAGESKPVAN